MTTSHDQRANPGRRLVRQRLADLPGCEDWNAAVERAREDYAEHPTTRYCTYPKTDDEDCYNAATHGRYCAGHAAFVARSTDAS